MELFFVRVRETNLAALVTRLKFKVLVTLVESQGQHHAQVFIFVRVTAADITPAWQPLSWSLNPKMLQIYCEKNKNLPSDLF